MTSNNGLFIFRRDLRVYDNTSLISLMKTCERVYCIFIFNPIQVEYNEYKSENSVQFMIESLCDLDAQIQQYNRSCKLS